MTPLTIASIVTATLFIPTRGHANHSHLRGRGLVAGNPEFPEPTIPPDLLLFLPTKHPFYFCNSDSNFTTFNVLETPVCGELSYCTEIDIVTTRFEYDYWLAKFTHFTVSGNNENLAEFLTFASDHEPSKLTIACSKGSIKTIPKTTAQSTEDHRDSEATETTTGNSETTANATEAISDTNILGGDIGGIAAITAVVIATAATAVTATVIAAKHRSKTTQTRPCVTNLELMQLPNTHQKRTSFHRV